MKKVMFLLAALLIGGMMFTGCSKDDPNAKGLYSYTTKQNINGATDDISALLPFVGPKVNAGMVEMTKAEARADWDAFYKSIQNVYVQVNGANSYYVVMLNRVESQGDSFVAVENIGKQEWGHVPAE